MCAGARVRVLLYVRVCVCVCRIYSYVKVRLDGSTRRVPSRFGPDYRRHLAHLADHLFLAPLGVSHDLTMCEMTLLILPPLPRAPGRPRISCTAEGAPRLYSVYNDSFVYHCRRLAHMADPVFLAPLSVCHYLFSCVTELIYVCDIIYSYTTAATSRTWPTTCFSRRRWSVISPAVGWLRLVGSIKLQVSVAECCLFYRALLQKRPIILSILLIKATPYIDKACTAALCV